MRLFPDRFPAPLCRILYHTFILCSYRASVILYFLTDFSRTNLRTHYCYGIIFHSFTQRSIFKGPKNRFRKELSMTDYSAFIAITNHHLLPPDSDTLDFIPGSVSYHRFLAQVEIIAATNVSAIVLREKDLEETVYEALAKDCITLCTHYNKKLILHFFLESAHRLNHPYIQLSLSQLETYRKAGLLSDFAQIGTSVHSVDDVRLAEKLGADYVFAGNIYETECKAGLAGRGLAFLKEVCDNTCLPVYAIGGMTPDRLPGVLEAGAKGACMMSGFMKL